jgi:chloride channel 3/4/5
MASRQPSSSSMTTLRPRRPSVASRISIAVSNATDLGEGGPAPTGVEHQIDEEIDEIKRYEVRLLRLAMFNKS